MLACSVGLLLLCLSLHSRLDCVAPGQKTRSLPWPVNTVPETFEREVLATAGASVLLLVALVSWWSHDTALGIKSKPLLLHLVCVPSQPSHKHIICVDLMHKADLKTIGVWTVMCQICSISLRDDKGTLWPIAVRTPCPSILMQCADGSFDHASGADDS